jgi:hypothetical protein
MQLTEKRYEGCGLDSTGSEYNAVAGSCEHGNDPSVSIKGGEFCDQQSDYQFLMTGSAVWS